MPSRIPMVPETRAGVGNVVAVWLRRSVIPVSIGLAGTLLGAAMLLSLATGGLFLALLPLSIANHGYGPLTRGLLHLCVMILPVVLILLPVVAHATRGWRRGRRLALLATGVFLGPWWAATYAGIVSEHEAGPAFAAAVTLIGAAFAALAYPLGKTRPVLGGART